MKIGVYVGSFNPVHNGHVKIVNYLLEKKLDKVIMIATSNYWNKRYLLSIDKRIEMLKLISNKNIIIDEENNDLPYTYLIMESLKNKYKKDELYLIIGADNIVDFDKWKEYETLLKYNLVIINRHNININYYLKKLNKLDKYIITDSLPNIDISSTIIRENILNNNYDNIDDKINKRVLEYIIKNKLYK